MRWSRGAITAHRSDRQLRHGLLGDPVGDSCQCACWGRPAARRILARSVRRILEAEHGRWFESSYERLRGSGIA